ncbi:hypothetical protein [Hoeflea sp.]|uniref:hypothetical protein n=1 Tax=Hoeflea sp. TaxID=1940281 RepID=UPI0025C52418|nr:hypothetical protein [Hoeflea sp.]
MKKSGNPYTTYEGGDCQFAPSYDDSIRATGYRQPACHVERQMPKGRGKRIVRKIDFRVLPVPGTVLMHEAQRYVVVGSDLHINREGKTIPIILWQSHCAECGAPFECSSGLRSGSLNRRCPNHHAPGKAVSRSGRKRVARHLGKHGRRKKS